MCSKLIKTPARRYWFRSGVFIIKFEPCFTPFSSISNFDFEQENVSWDIIAEITFAINT